MHRLYLLLAIPAIHALSCNVDPLVLPIQDVQVIPDIDDSLIRGIPAKIGSEEQDIVLLPWAELNNTWVYDEQAYCDKTVIWNERICRIRRGNLYNESQSDTFEKAADIQAAGGAPEEAAHEGAETGIKKLVSTSLAGTDTFRPEGSSPLNDFPLGIPRLKWDAGYTHLHSLGLGSNSTYLNALRAAGKISSRVWSLFWGRLWITDSIDGSLVLGGYDEDKVIGKNYTAPLVYDDYTGTPGCWTGMKVILSDIRVNFRDGSDKSIFPSNTALPCCIVPQRQLLLEAPGAYVSKFQEVTGFNSTGSSYGLHWSAMLFDADKAFDGDITFHLDSGLQVRVPNDQYIVPSVDIDRNGSRVYKPDVRELLMNSLGDQPATLGRYFLTSAYLMVNHDAGTFTLWQANPSKKSSLVRVFDQDTANKCDDASGVVQPSATTTPGESQEPAEKTSTADDSTPISGGVIGGIVAAAVVVLGLVGFGIIYLVRRKRRARASQRGGKDAIQFAVQRTDDKPPGYHYSYPPQEMQSSNPMPSEMQGQTCFVYEMDGREGGGRR